MTSVMLLKLAPVGTKVGWSELEKPFDPAYLFATLIMLRCPQKPLSCMHTLYTHCVSEQFIRQQVLVESTIERNGLEVQTV